jgi:hypothetical protein
MCGEGRKIISAVTNVKIIKQKIDSASNSTIV